MIPRLVRAAVYIVALAVAFASAAQDYPARPVRVVVPFSPGGAVDGPMRLVAAELSKRWAQQVVVENKPGAGATIGTEIVAKSPPDGYTLLLASQTNAISATLYQKLPFDPIEDFAPITLIGREPGVLVVNPALPVKTLPEFIAYVKARPGQVDYASSGNGSGQHLFMAMLASMTGMQLSHVPYKGSGQATTDLLAGQVMASIPGTAGMVGHIKAGKLRPLAVTGSTRSQQLPFDPIEDFAPISLIGREPGVLVVHPSLPVKSVAEFVAYAKERPGKVDYASSGNGSGQHLFMALFASSTGIKLNHVPYRGSGQATADLLGGTVPAAIPGTAGMVGHIKAGKLRPLAVTGATRSPQLPDVPTMMEAGVAGYETYVWMGLLAPKGTPAAIVDRLYREVVAALATPDVKARMATAGIEIVGSTPAEFGAFFRAERDLWAKVVRDTGAKID